MIITIEITEGYVNTVGKFPNIEMASQWLKDRREEKKYSLNDLEVAFKAGRMKTLNRQPFNPITDFHYMTFDSYIR